MASLNDILSAAQNIVSSINNAAKTYLNVNGVANAAGLTTATVVKSSAGRVCSINVIVAGAAVGYVYDATSASSTSNPLFTIPMTAGVFVVNIATSYGIVVAPGSGQTVTVSYS